MILLKRLRIHALKQLRDVEIWFPRRGSLLIEGHNEAGKSTLFEAVYFAIYGAPLVGEETAATLKDLIPHGGSSAGVELTLVAGQTELDIRRTVGLARGKAQAGQQARVIVRRPGAPTEEIHGPRPVNIRILHELHELNGDTLRNSCFMEQKALERLEALTRGQREVAIARLLGLDHLQQVAHALESECADLRKELDLKRGELEVATWQRSERDAAERTRQWERRAAAVEAYDLIARRDAVEDTVAGKSARITALHEEMRATERRIRHAEEVRGLLEAVRATQGRLQEAQAGEQRYSRLIEELDALDRLERVEAQPLERRLALLGALANDAARAEDLTARVDALRELRQAATELAVRRQDREEARRRLDETEALAARATTRSALQEWTRLTEREALVTDGGAQREQVARAREEALRTSRQVERRARVALATGIGLLIGGLLAGAGGLAWHPLWGVAGVALISAVAAGVWHSDVRRGLPAAKAAARSAAEALTRLEAREEMARGLPGTAEDLAHIEDALRRAGATPPRTVEEARAQLALAPAREDATAARVKDDLEAARRALMQRETQYDAALERLDALRSRSAAILGEWALADDLAQPLVELLAARENLLAHVAEQAAEADIAPERSAVIVARGTAEVRLRDLRARLDQRERLREDARAAESALREARSELAARLAELIGQARALDIEAIELSAEANNLDLLNLTWKTLHATLATAYMRLGETSERERLAALGSRIEEVDQGARETGLDRAGTIQALRDSLATQGVVCAGDETLAELCALWPPLADAAADDPGAVERELLAARNDAYHARESAARAAKARNLEGVTLDEQACRAEVETGELALRRRMTAASMAAETQARIFRRVIPETALHMRALLPALTDGRYRDVELVAENESAGAADLKIRVWDQLAGRFVAKNLFSGGTRDQCSLALRLAFALATLPKEVGATPGFVFLDEPLSSFDSERSRALIEVLTHGAIADQFAQVMLVSHSRSFDQRSFRYRLRMAEGRIVETNLPDEREAERLWAVESAIVESTGA